MEGALLFVVLILISNSGGLKKPGLITGVLRLVMVVRIFNRVFPGPDPQFFSSENLSGFV